MIYFLIAAYNEKENISNLLSEIKTNYPDEKSRQVIIVDDGSTDGTADEAKKTMPSVELLVHKKNMGLGNALKTGFTKLLSEIKPEDCLITLDADSTHPLNISKEMLEKLDSADVVIASRYVFSAKEVGLSVLRKTLSRLSNFFLKLFFPHPNLNDYTSGYRAFRSEILLKAGNIYKDKFITEGGFAVTAEILLKLLKIKPEVAEVPLILRYDLKKGKTKMKMLRTILSYITLTLKNKFG